MRQRAVAHEEPDFPGSMAAGFTVIVVAIRCYVPVNLVRVMAVLIMVVWNRGPLRDGFMRRHPGRQSRGVPGSEHDQLGRLSESNCVWTGAFAGAGWETNEHCGCRESVNGAGCSIRFSFKVIHGTAASSAATVE